MKLCEEKQIVLTQTTEDIFETQSGYVVTKTFCSCMFFRSMSIPCRHIFKLLQNENCDLYVPALCSVRWTKQYYRESHPSLSAYDQVNPPQPISVQRIRVPDEVSKYKKTANVTKEINNLASSMTPAQYAIFQEKLITFKNNMMNSNDETEEMEEVRQERSATIMREQSTLTSNATSTVTSVRNLTSQTVPSAILGSVAIANATRLVFDEAGPSSRLLYSDSRNDIAVLKLPQKIISIGRPKGKTNTVVGLKRKALTASKSEPVVPVKRRFLDLSFPNQSLSIVRWLTNKSSAQILSKKTSYHEIIQDPNVFNRLRNDGVDVRGTKKHFDAKCYQTICSEIQKLENKHWGCGKCAKNLSGSQIMCHGCLDWYHLKCSGYTKSKGNDDFFCGF